MVEITRHVHSIDGLEHPFPGVRIVPYLVEEGPNDLTLIDTCFVAELPKLEAYINNSGYSMKEIKRIIISHVHVDHTQATNEIKKRSGGQAKIYSHWADAGYLAHNPPYHGPLTHQTIQNMLQRYGVTTEDVVKKFGTMEREAILVDGLQAMPWPSCQGWRYGGRPAGNSYSRTYTCTYSTIFSKAQNYLWCRFSIQISIRN